MDISVVVPLYNEEESLPELFAWIERVMKAHDFSYEVIFFFFLCQHFESSLFYNTINLINRTTIFEVYISYSSTDQRYQMGSTS